MTPTGNTPWLRTNSLETYGGHATKVNYQSQGVVDPTTDVSAEQFCRLAEDVAQLARVTEFATVTILCNDSSPAAPTVSYYDALAGNAPTPTRNGDGDATLTWAASYIDGYGVSGDIHIAHAEASGQGATPMFVTWELSDPDTNGKNERVRLRAFDEDGAAVPDAVITVTVSTSAV